MKTQNEFEPLLSEDEWGKLIREWCKQFDGGKHQRVGQAYVNSLFNIRPDLHETVTSDESIDCFYDDTKVIHFIRFLNGNGRPK